MGDYSKTDLMYEIIDNPRFVPVKSPRVSLKTVTEGAESRHVMCNHHSGQYYRMDDASKTIWDLIDGTRTIEEIARDAQASGKISSPQTTRAALLFYAESGLLRAKEDPVLWRRVRTVSSFETQVTIVRDSTKLFSSVERVLRPILKRYLFWASMVLVLVAAIIFAPRFSSTFDDAVNFEILGSTVVGLLFYNLVVLAPVIAIHELSHGLAAVHYAGRAGEIGTGLFYFGPMFYVDVTHSWRLPRRERIMISWAGNLSTVLIGALIVLAGLFVKYPSSIAQILNMVAFWCFYMTLWNLAPPFETDGYYILSDIVNMPELRRDGFAYLKSVILRLFGQFPPEPEGLTDRKRATLLGYSIFSLVFVAYLAVQSVRFTIYMAEDAGFWAGRIGASAFSGQTLPLLAYFVGIASVGYFVISLSGYGVFLREQVRKSLTRMLRFEALHDRDLSVFFYLPSRASSIADKLESKIRSVAGSITSNFTIDRQGPLYHTTLRLGGASLPLEQIKLHLRRVEDRFSRTYLKFVAWKRRSMIHHLASLPNPSPHIPLARLLTDMADKTSIADRVQVKGALKEFLERQERTRRYLLGSTFASVWTIEIPPVLQYELEESMLSGLLIQDLTMTDLAGDIEEFKKRTIYGLDSIAELAARTSAIREETLAHPEKFQVVAFFEPVRGRIIFVGRTERVEKDLEELGPVFVIQVWSGYLDSLLVDVNLNLYSISMSFPSVPDALSILRDSEVRALRGYVSSLEKLEAHVRDVLTKSLGATRPCRERLRQLSSLFQPEKTSMIGGFGSILGLNIENLRSVQSHLRESVTLSKKCFQWVRALRELLEKEQGNRHIHNLARKRKILRPYLAVGPLSALLLVAGLLQPVSWLTSLLFGLAGSFQAAYLVTYYLSWRSANKVPRYPSMVFSQILTPIYALAQTMYSLIMGASTLDPLEVLTRTGKRVDRVRVPSQKLEPVTT